MCEGMVTELCTRYGNLFMILFDGGADDPWPVDTPGKGKPFALSVFHKFLEPFFLQVRQSASAG